MNSEELVQQKIAAGETFAIKFWAPWCRPCAALTKDIEINAPELKTQLVEINIDELFDMADDMHIKSIPTVVIFKNGAESARLGGSKVTAQLIKEGLK